MGNHRVGLLYPFVLIAAILIIGCGGSGGSGGSSPSGTGYLGNLTVPSGIVNTATGGGASQLASKSTSSSSTSGQQVLNFSGSYSGGWTSTKYSGWGGKVTVSMVHNGTALSGSIKIYGTEVGDVSGSISGSVIISGGVLKSFPLGVAVAGGLQANYKVTYVLVKDATDWNVVHFEGTYYSPSNGDSGTFWLDRN